MRGRSSSPWCYSQGGQGQLCEALGYQCCPRQLFRSQTSTWSLVVTWAMVISSTQTRYAVWPRTQTWPSEAIRARISPRPQVTSQATHTRLFFSALRAPDLPLFVALKLSASLSLLPLYLTRACHSGLMLCEAHALGRVSGCLQVSFQPKISRENKSLAKIGDSPLKLWFNTELSSLTVELLPQPANEISS